MENWSNITVRWFVDELLESTVLLFVFWKKEWKSCCGCMTEKEKKDGKTKL